MKIKIEDIEKLVREELSLIKGLKDTKKYSFTARDISQLEKSTNIILAAVQEKIPGVSGASSIGYESLLKQEKPTVSQLKKVAEGDVIDQYRDRFLGRRGTAKSQFSPDEEEERISLRKKYYGPEGDISKKMSAKARKGLEKGIGELSPEEMEAGGYVLEVPKEILEDFSVMVNELKRSGDLFEEAKDWYHSINRLMLKETGSETDAALFGLLIATYSPRAKFSLNLMEAAFMYKAIAADAKSNPKLLRQFAESFPVKKLSKPDEGPQRKIGYLKVANFALNLIAPELAGSRDPESGQLEYNEIYRWNSTIDTWMIDAFYPMLRKASTAKEYSAIKGKMMSDPFTYSYLSELVAKEAKKLDLLPHELQAIIWVAMKRRQSGEDAATTKESIGQIEQSLKSIAEYRGDLEKMTDELENGSNWVRVLFKEIDTEGLQSAADYALGIKQDNKWIAPGLRSIAARGKSGDQFKYFPDEPKPPKEKEKIKRVKGPKKPPKEKEMKPYEDPRFNSLASYYVMNTVIQMPTGKFGNLYNSIMMYLEPGFNVGSAVSAITGAFDRGSKKASKFLEEVLNWL